MDADEKLAKWAALFVRAYSEGDAAAVPAGRPQPAADVRYPGVTPGASELLQAVDAGGVPTFVTANLLKIAEDNGVAASPEWTPNQIIEAIRNKARECDPVGKSDSAAPSGQ